MTKKKTPLHIERVELIDKYSKIVDSFSKIREKRDLSEKELQNFRTCLEELARLKRIERGFNSIFDFGHIYCSGKPPNDFIRKRTPSPPFHRELCDELYRVAMSEDEEKTATAAPRGHAKSVWTTNIFPVWVTCYKNEIKAAPYWVIVGDKEESANGQLAVVKSIFETNELLIEDFGSFVGPTWNVSNIITSNGVEFETAGILAGIRGRKSGSVRPNVIFDDVEKDENCNTAEQIAKIVDKFDRAFMQLGDEQSKYILVGTVISYSSLLNQILTQRGDWRKRKYSAVVSWPDRMDLWQRWKELYHDRSEGSNPIEATEIASRKAKEFYEANKDDMERGSVILWPERRNLYRLMVEREINRHGFLTEYQNEPLDEETRVFNMDKARYYVPEDVRISELDCYYACDPSMGQSAKSDFSAIIVIGVHRKTGLQYVLEADIRRRHPSQIIRDIIAFHRKYRFIDGWTESIGFQSLVNSELRRVSAEAGVRVPASEFMPRNRDKISRIKTTLATHVHNGYIMFNPRHSVLIEQLLYFPKHARKDGPDALAMAVESLEERKGGITLVSI